ncbi:2'-5' RNA ligase family protein [Microbacterium resistens]|uniref:2'-5' RNA ligase family protein n=1 Tax=Microbacterium resistens TaxID=156977 RepID=UPI001C5766F9|nr:2'-5' RNA ligase family protein [Microbacterium resistens]MBW1639241.1 2'-5' RNA ligase family protein [Microbacterium resistens]
MSESAHRFPAVHAALGVDLNELGCIMATVEPIEVTDYADDAGLDPDRDLYSLRGVDPSRWWIDGAVAEHGAHVTLLYGLLQPGPAWRAHVDELLADVDLSTVTVDHVSMFDSPYPGDPYRCIVAHLQLTPELRKAHARLSYLPHVNTFPEYRPHVTLAYVKDQPSGVDWARTTPEAWVRALNPALRGAPLPVTGIDYGGRP